MRTRREKKQELAVVHKFTLNFPVKKESRKTKKKNSRDHRFHPDDNKRIEVGIAAEIFFKKQNAIPIRGEEEQFTHQKTKPRKKTKQTPPSQFSETTSYGSIPFAVLVWNGALWRLETSTGIIGANKAPS
jgi:hypothetical protein